MQRLTSRMLLLAAALASVGLHAGATERSSTPELVARELSAVVNISSLRPSRAPTGMIVANTSSANAIATGTAPGNGAPEPSNRPRLPRAARVLGSGFIIDPSGIIVTNRHVIEGTTDILVTLQDNTLLRAKLLAKADQIDVVLLKVTPDTPLPTVRFGDSDALRVADPVLAIGSPLGFGGSVTRGIVSALNRDIRDSPFDDYIRPTPPSTMAIPVARCSTCKAKSSA